MRGWMDGWVGNLSNGQVFLYKCASVRNNLCHIVNESSLLYATSSVHQGSLAVSPVILASVTIYLLSDLNYSMQRHCQRLALGLSERFGLSACHAVGQYACLVVISCLLAARLALISGIYPIIIAETIIAVHKHCIGWLTIVVDDCYGGGSCGNDYCGRWSLWRRIIIVDHDCGNDCWGGWTLRWHLLL